VSSPELLEPVLASIPTKWKLARSLVVDRLYSYIAGSARVRPNVRPLQVLYTNTHRLVRSENPDELLEVFESDLSSYFAHAARHCLFIHAGVVGWKGQAIVIPGQSFSGKTTIVQEFLRAGADYFSDEFAVLDGQGCVLPFPRLLSVREGRSKRHGQERIRAEELGARVGVTPLPMGLLLCTRYRPGASWRPRTLSPARGVLALLANTLAARNQPRFALITLEAAIRHAQCLKGDRGEAREVVESILQRLDTNLSTGQQQGWHSLVEKRRS
jgi:hypothetical protein